MNITFRGYEYIVNGTGPKNFQNTFLVLAEMESTVSAMTSNLEFYRSVSPKKELREKSDMVV
jgi:hypothetical protein